MPRNITVTLADGSQHVYANAPDDITPDVVTARAQKDFGQGVTALDGGKSGKPAPAAPPAAPAVNPNNPQTADDYAARWSNLSPAQARGLLQKYNSGVATGDPRSQALARIAGVNLQPKAAPTQAQRVQQSAQARSQQNVASSGNFLTALKAGVTRGMFGIPERLAAAGEAYLPSAITGNTSNASYGQILDTIRANTDADAGQSTAGNLVGQIAGGIGAGAGAAGLVGKGAAALSEAASPVAQGAGNFLQSLMTLKKGQGVANAVANAAKVVTGGAAAGATQAAGEGSDIASGAETGAAGAALLGGGFKAAQVITRPFRDIMRMSGAGQLLGRLTGATMDELATKAADYRAKTGAEPTVFELLPASDRNNILKQAVVGRDDVVDHASDAIRQRAGNLGPEMQARARELLDPNRNLLQGDIHNDMATARQGQADPADTLPVEAAMRSPTDMSTLRDNEARAIMAPHDNTPVADTFGDILPQHPQQQADGTIASVDSDPAVTAAIRSAVPGGFRAPDQGVTAGDMSDMIQTLRGDLGKGGIEGRTAQRAIDHLTGELEARAPDAAAAHTQMTDAYAARSRMMEGMKEGTMSRLRDDVQVETNRGAARKNRNAYDTPEGQAGLALGQGNQILSDFGNSPDEALRATIGISRGSTGRQMAQNIGTDAAHGLTNAAQAQDTSARALASASSMAQSGGGEAASPETLVAALAGLHPGSFITTKAGALKKLSTMTYIPNSRARTMVDMLFSQDPAMTSRAMNAIGNEPNGAKFLQYLGGVTGAVSSSPSLYAGAAPTDTLPNVDTSAAAPADAPQAPDAPAPAAAGPVAEENSPYAPNLQKIYDTESPEMLDLISRVAGQESSGGNQFDAKGQPLTSSAGAIGAMQVMPDTGPEAARLAGVPWDANAYRNDPAYNKLIGIGYLSELLRRYDGDVAKAVAAYNAGHGRVDAAIKGGGDWTARLPAETRDYVRKVA